ncbi:hypothetical protein L1887_50406 [Cichorium endivia]|nr:hypothetical protein L1887_50406 [Cichorium endivia]
MRLRRKSLQPKSAEEPSDVPALLIECQHVAVLSVRSPHGLYGLGHTRATMAITMGSKAVRRSESGKIASVRIVLCNSGT